MVVVYVPYAGRSSGLRRPAYGAGAVLRCQHPVVVLLAEPVLTPQGVHAELATMSDVPFVREPSSILFVRGRGALI